MARLSLLARGLRHKIREPLANPFEIPLVLRLRQGRRRLQMNGAKQKAKARAKKGAEPSTTSEVGSSMGEKRELKKADDKADEPSRAAEDSSGTGPAGDSACTAEPSDQHYAPEAVLQEEERLRKEREAGTKGAFQEIFAEGDDGVLSDDQFKKLDVLIERTNVFTSFLYEQMQENEEEEAVEDADKGAAGKRKRSSKPARQSKRAKTQSKTAQFLPLIEGELRDYQIAGVKWMISLWQNGMNGILADQMGLGKTIQTIAFISHLWTKGIYGPFMIIGPLSTLPNWVAEIARFCPTIKSVLYHGAKKERAELQRTRLKLGKDNKPDKTFPIVVTSYEIAMADIKFLQKFSWKYVIVDEGHRLKNWNCKLLRELRTLESGNKLILSGTPLQNNLSELWSLLNFLLPEIFSSMSTFESWFDFSSITDGRGGDDVAAQQQRNQVVSKLHTVLKPFLLRRIKSDVETSLPPKKEIVLYATMTDTQKEINAQLRDRTLHDVMTKRQREEGGRKINTAKLNNMIMQMRKNCNHPDLISSAFTNDVYFPSSEELLKQCGKLQLLNRLLVQLKRKGHKVLVFSQMTRMLDILDTFLEQEGHKSCRLDGSVSWQDRQKAMKEFNTDPDLFCFLLSTRAGGLGINLTAADTVIMYDSDWNPHQDMQAMDRAHRIGQEKPVLVFRLATGNSVEGRMLKRANSKLMLERLVIRKGAFVGEAPRADASSMSNEELMELLQDNIPLKDEPQAGAVSDKVLDQLLNRDHLWSGKAAPYKDADVGFEVMKGVEGAGLLATVQ